MRVVPGRRISRRHKLTSITLHRQTAQMGLCLGKGGLLEGHKTDLSPKQGTGALQAKNKSNEEGKMDISGHRAASNLVSLTQLKRSNGLRLPSE